MVLHWLIAIAVIANWLIPMKLEGLPHEQFMDAMWPHKALGLIIFALVVLRLGWRLIRKPPPYSSAIRPWEKALAKTVHIAFYVLLLAMPALGYVGNSYDGSNVNMFGLFTIGRLAVPDDDHFAHQIFHLHGTLGTILMLLVVLHVIGALKHQLFDCNGELFRMLPFGRPRP
jgi:cytochrome b561